MDTSDCKHCLYSAPNPLILGRHNVYHRSASCVRKFGARAQGEGDERNDREQPPSEDNNGMQHDSAGSDYRDDDNRDQGEEPDQGHVPPVVDDGSPADRPFDTNMELVLLLDRLRVSRALQQDVLDFLFHPDFDLSEVLPQSGTFASRNSVTCALILFLYETPTTDVCP